MKKFNLTAINYNNSVIHLILLALITVFVFALPAGLWTAAPLNEALFFRDLKETYALRYPELVMHLSGAVAGHGISLWPLRIFTALTALITLTCTYFSAKKLCNLNVAFLAALTLATMPLFARYAVMGLPCMWLTALVSLPTAIWFTAPAPLSWRRWLLIWLCALAAVLYGGLSALYSILIFLVGNFLLSTGKKQQLCSLGLLLPLTFFIAALAVLSLYPPPAAENWLSNDKLVQSVSGASLLGDAQLWGRLHQTLLISLGIWLLACVVIILWQIVRLLGRKPVDLPQQKALCIWFMAALLPALLTVSNESGRFLVVLPPLAVWAACFLDRYARYKTTRPKAYHSIKTDALMLKALVACWGLLLGALALYLLFNLEQAWQRDIYLETPDIAILGGCGVVLLLLALRAFWIKCRSYALWGFVVVMLLSFNFIHNAVLKPAEDMLHTPRYFSQNLATLFPEIKWQGLVVGVNRASRPEILKARYFLYADYPIRVRPVSAAGFLLSHREALPQRLLIDGDVMASLGKAPFKAGYIPVYWEEVDGVLLTILELADEPALETQEAQETPQVLTLAAKSDDAGTAASWAAGYCLAGGYLVPYEGPLGPAASPTGITRFSDFKLQIFKANVGEGLRNAYTFHWLLKAGQFYRQPHTGLELHNQTAYINKHWPYNYDFQRWALDTLNKALKPDFITFSGLNPTHGRTRRVLNRLLETDALKQSAVTTLALSITVENIGEYTFLRFHQEGRKTLALELRATN